MTARHAWPHPAWCSPADCRAYAGGDFEPLHRSQAVVFDSDPRQALAVYLTEHVDYPGQPDVEIVSLHAPVVGRVWLVDDVLAELSMPLNAASILADVLRRLIRQAATS